MVFYEGFTFRVVFRDVSLREAVTSAYRIFASFELRWLDDDKTIALR